MKGISYLKDKKNRKKAIVIELKAIEENAKKVYEAIDVLVAESRRDDEIVDWETAKKQLRKKGRL